MENNFDFENDIIKDLNEARMTPSIYAAKIRKYIPYFKKNNKVIYVPNCHPIETTEGAVAYEEAAKFFDILKPVRALVASEGLNLVSIKIANDVKELTDLDKINDIPVDTYLDKHGEVDGKFAQAFDFGSSFAELAVINLLVGDGDSDRKNRSSLLDDSFKLIGVKHAEHPTYEYFTVIMYAERYVSIGQSNSENATAGSKIIKKVVQTVKAAPVQEVTNKLKDLKVKEVESKKDSGSVDDFELPLGLIKIERQEKYAIVNGIKKKMIKLIKHKDDGLIDTEVFYENC